MFHILLESLSSAFGFNEFSIISTLHMLARSLVIYFFGISLARFNKKLLGVRTPFNFILFIMLGSIFAGAIVDVKHFIPVILTVVFLVTINGLTTTLAFFFPSVALFLKGKPSDLIIKGKIQWKNMRKHLITNDELLTELHAQLHTNDLKQVERAILASDGSINFIKIEV